MAVPFDFLRSFGTISQYIYAGIAQLIERFLAKEEARSLSLLTRTIPMYYKNTSNGGIFCLLK
jgi:hypothetical protein